MSHIVVNWKTPNIKKRVSKRLRVQICWLWIVFPILFFFLLFLDILCISDVKDKVKNNGFLTTSYFKDLFNTRPPYKNGK